MGKKLIITEKPSVARDFAQVLGVSGRQDGYIENENYVITWCVGHLVEMVYPEVYDERYKKWKLEDLPFLPRDYKYDVIPAVSKQYDIVHRMLHREDVDTVYWAGDAGKEGQTIEENIRNFGGVREGMKELRVWIDSQTEEEIRRGINEAKPMSDYANLGKSGIMRTIEDYAMGINFSRAMSVKYGNLLNDAAGTSSYTAIAVGRVMTCVLGMVVIREREIRNFRETPFYRVVGSFAPMGVSLDTGAAQAEWKAVEGSKYFESPFLYKENGFKEEGTARQLISELMGRKATVASIEQGISKKKAPLLFNLAELQAECAKRFKISPDETLQVAQDLYEKKLTTYPRTDARVLSTAVAKEIGKNISRLKGYEPTAPYVEKIMKEGLHYNIAKTAYVDDSKVTDHYAIIPTGQLTELGSLNSLQRAVFDLIVRRFLSIFYPAAEYQTVKLTVEMKHPGANGDYTEKFFTSTKVLKSPGYLEVANYKKNSDNTVDNDTSERDGESDNGNESEKDENRGLLALAQRIKNGDELNVQGFEIKEGKTSPPKRYTSGSMVLAMENAGQLIEDEELRAQIKGSGIGTSATRAEIIKKLVRIGYLNLNKKSQILSPETLGEMVFEVVSMTVPALLNPKMTASWEKGLDGITRGTVVMEEYREKLEDFIRKETLAMIQNDQKQQLIHQIQPLTGKGARGVAAKKKLGLACPMCGGELETTPFGYGCSNYKKDGTGCKFSMGTVAGRDLSEEEFKTLIEKGRTEVLNGFISKNRKKFSGALVLEKDEEGKISINFDFSENKPEVIEDVKCPACGGAIVKTPFGYACEKRNRNVEGSCTFAIGKMAEKDLNPAQVKELLTAGRTSTIRGFKGKSGKKFDACVALEKDETGNYTTKFDFEHVETKKVKEAFCPKCGGEILVVSFGYVCANRNPNTPDGCDFSIGKIAEKDLNEAQVKELLENGRTSTIRGFKSKTGKKFDACITLDKAEDGTIKGLKFDFEHVEAKKVKDVQCPLCKGDIVQTPFGFGCANYSKDNPDSCRFSVGKMAEKALNEAQVKELLTNGRTSTIRGFKSKEGKKFDARVALNKDETGKVTGLKFDFTDLEAPKVKDVKCPLCKGDIVQTPFGFGCANYSKDNPDSCRFSIGKIAGVKLKEAQVKELLIKKKTEIIKGFVAKTGMMFDAPLKLTEDGQVTFDFPEKPKPVETSVACPKCQKKLMKAQWNYECECGFKVSHTVAKVELSEEVIKELLETGRTREKVIGFTSKAGNIFDACLKFEDDRISFDFDNPGSSGSGGNSTGGEERPFYEELDSKPITVDSPIESGSSNNDDDSEFGILNMQDDAQYIDDDVPAFYDAMAAEYAAYDEQDMEEQTLANQLLGDSFLLDNE
ncbi:MAG: topoisomerase C-terminal repeat-containing protein [Lachnospiraceae bacterium]|nr:topoisomerase C-terminal repeat-containing protein [Lachnospiraceae bacterium]